MPDTLVSIIIPVYNHAKELEQCIASIVGQSMRSSSTTLEIVIVNDGSTDDFNARLLTIKGQIAQAGIRLKYVDQVNYGAAVARNVGFDTSTGEYLFFCDADIQLEPTALEKLIGALESEPSAAFSYCQFRFGWKTFQSSPFDLEKLRKVNYIHTSALIRRSVFPHFDESLKKFQDWDLFLTIAERGGRGVFVPEILFTIATGGTMSQWLPAFAYHVPFKYLPWWSQSVRKYDVAKKIITQKHRIMNYE